MLLCWHSCARVTLAKPDHHAIPLEPICPDTHSHTRAAAIPLLLISLSREIQGGLFLCSRLLLSCAKAGERPLCEGKWRLMTPEARNPCSLEVDAIGFHEREAR